MATQQQAAPSDANLLQAIEMVAKDKGIDRARLMKTLGKALFPKLNVDEGSEWMGRRPALPDTIPVIGQVPGHPDVILAFGHGHLGLTGAPMTGRIATAIAIGDRLNVDVAAYAPARFA
jgi:D-amino-acid dehydrogenase